MAKPKAKTVRKKVVKKIKTPTASEVFEAQLAVNNSAPEFLLSVNICGNTVETKTSDITGSILSFKPKMIKGKVLFTVTHKGKTVERVFKPFEARRLFNNKLMADFFTKNIILRLK